MSKYRLYRCMHWVNLESHLKGLLGGNQGFYVCVHTYIRTYTHTYIGYICMYWLANKNNFKDSLIDISLCSVFFKVKSTLIMNCIDVDYVI
uniref:Uncharacterized protein n=1 Tax=Anguilla anguilla TaxID=7936 RepID=A0A0E9XZC0_ANGAN